MKKISKRYFEEYKENPIGELTEYDNRILNSIMLEVYQQRSDQLDCCDVFKKYVDNYEFFGPSHANLKEINAYNKIFLDTLPSKYDCIELSPITPFGGNSSISNLSQKNILSTIKNSEVCSDATTALTLEACKRRKELIKNPENINTEVNIATIKKVLRLQRFDKEKGFLQHFGQFAAITAGRKKGGFEYKTIYEHVKLWVDLLERLKENGYTIGELNVGLSNINIIEHFIKNDYIGREIINANSFNDYDLFKEQKIKLPSRIESYDDLTINQINNYNLFLIKHEINSLSNIINDLNSTYDDVKFYIEMDRKGGLGYYVGSCFHIYSDDEHGFVPLCDGGVPNWNGRLMKDNKETSVVSGIGSELVLNMYGRKNK